MPQPSRGPAAAAVSLIEILVVLSIIVVLVGTLLPTVSLVKASANSMRCQSNLRQLFLASHVYGEDEGGCLPPSRLESGNRFWFGYLGPYVDGSTKDSNAYQDLQQGRGVLWNCPSFVYKVNYTVAYGMNPWLMGKPGSDDRQWKTSYRNAANADYQQYWGTYTVFAPSRIPKTAKRVLFCDSNTWYLPFDWPVGTYLPRHNHMNNVAFADGHVGQLSTAQVLADGTVY